MRESEFPFAKYRDWGETPAVQPELNVDALLSLADWQSTAYRRPITDDITGFYNFYPSMNGASSYAKRASMKSFAGKTALSEGITAEEFLGKKERQSLHIAESAESAIAVFWVVAQLRKEVLASALSHISDGKKMPSDVAAYAADAIADLGHCMLYPVDIDHTGKDHGKELGKFIKSISGDTPEKLQAFGLYAGKNPEALETYEGVSSMEVVLSEQERRCDYWSPRHQAVLEAFPEVRPSNEVLYMQLPLDELLSIEFPRVA